jgi:hypothetical protein
MALRVNSPVLSPFLLASARRPDLRGNGICSGQGSPADGKVGRQHYVPSRHGAGDRPSAASGDQSLVKPVRKASKNFARGGRVRVLEQGAGLRAARKLTKQRLRAPSRVPTRNPCPCISYHLALPPRFRPRRALSTPSSLTMRSC